jgi:exodeoxyribonuclease VII small subunit
MNQKPAIPPSPDSPINPEPAFEAMLDALDKSVRSLETGDLELTDALKQYELGVKWIARCQALLEQAEQRVALLTGMDPDGNPTLVPRSCPNPTES